MNATAPKDNRITGLLSLYDMQTPFFASVTDGISETDAHNRNNTKANHVAWLAGSLVQQRFDLAEMFTGKEHRQAAHDLFKDNQGIKDGITYPALDSYKKDWDSISPILRDALTNVSTEKLDSLFKVPGMEFPYYDMILFSLYREANMIGQIALWRRLMGYEAMKYM